MAFIFYFCVRYLSAPVIMNFEVFETSDNQKSLKIVL